MPINSIYFILSLFGLAALSALGAAIGFGEAFVSSLVGLGGLAGIAMGVLMALGGRIRGGETGSISDGSEEPLAPGWWHAISPVSAYLCLLFAASWLAGMAMPRVFESDAMGGAGFAAVVMGCALVALPLLGWQAWYLAQRAKRDELPGLSDAMQRVVRCVATFVILVGPIFVTMLLLDQIHAFGGTMVALCVMVTAACSPRVGVARPGELAAMWAFPTFIVIIYGVVQLGVTPLAQMQEDLGALWIAEVFVVLKS